MDSRRQCQMISKAAEMYTERHLPALREAQLTIEKFIQAATAELPIEPGSMHVSPWFDESTVSGSAPSVVASRIAFHRANSEEINASISLYAGPLGIPIPARDMDLPRAAIVDTFATASYIERADEDEETEPTLQITINGGERVSPGSDLWDEVVYTFERGLEAIANPAEKVGGA